MANNFKSGYVHCACRDCMEVTISSEDDAEEGALCLDCEEAGCEAGAGECCVEHEEFEGEDPHAVSRYCGSLLTGT